MGFPEDHSTLAVNFSYWPSVTTFPCAGNIILIGLSLEMFKIYEHEISRGGADLRQLLSRFFLGAAVGDRVPAVRELAKLYGASLGSVSTALTTLEEDDAVALERRGRLGTFLQARSLGRLWTAAEREPLVAALPLPSTPRFEGLATGLKMLLAQTGIEVFFIFVRGSRQRLKALRQNRCHIAVMSSFAAGELWHPEEASILELPAGSFVAEHRVFYAHRASFRERPLRVAVDRDSVDQKRLSELEFREQEIEFVSATYMQLARLLERGYADATVWSMDEMTQQRQLPLFRDRPLSESVRHQVGRRDTRASFVARLADTSVRAAIAEGLDVKSVMQVEEDVVAGRIVPEY